MSLVVLLHVKYNIHSRLVTFSFIVCGVLFEKRLILSVIHLSALRQEFHDDLTAKNREMEKLMTAPFGSGSRHQIPRDRDAYSARVAVLQNKWRTVWRLSVDRKKLLQDVLDHLLEVCDDIILVGLSGPKFLSRILLLWKNYSARATNGSLRIRAVDIN